MKPASEFILSISKGELWYVSSIHEACFHITIKVPPLEIDYLKIGASIGVSRYGRRNPLSMDKSHKTNQNVI